MKRQILLVGILLLVVSLACGLGGTVEEIVDDAVEGITTDDSSGGDTSGGDTSGGDTSTDSQGDSDDMPVISADALTGLDSYRARMVFRFTSDTGEVEETVMEQAETRNPPAQQYSMTFGDETIQWVQIESTMWASYGEGWFQSQQDPDEMAESFGEGLLWDPDDFARDIADYDPDYVGRETVNGVSTKHYTFVIPATEAAIFSGGQADDVEGEVWIADEADLPAFAVRYHIGWTGTNWSGQGEGEVELFYEIYEANSSFTIEPPEGAGDTGLPEDVPMYPDTSDFFAMEGMITYSALGEFSAVADFYRQQMAAQGWNLDNETDMAGVMAQQSWSKGGRSVEIMISPADGNSSAVVITLSE